MTKKIRISDLIKELNLRSARSVVGQLSLRSFTATNFLRYQYEKAPGEKGSFFADPVFEATFGWNVAEKTLRELEKNLLSSKVLKALSNPPTKPEDFSEYKFPLDRLPYKHQLQSWEKLLEDKPQSILVSSGTGSGKTECFLIPILEDLYREYSILEKNNPLVGVRALFLYPLNALINSQKERLTAWTREFDGGIRYCLYNGDTPMARTKTSAARETPEQVRDRTVLREAPPPILVTNSTMLEYMLVRKEDDPILKASQGKLRWIVLDEAHSYIGSQAAELALLLRRVMNAFSVNPEDVRFVATSATIGADNENTERSLKKFLADVAGVGENQVHIIRGHRKVPEIPPFVEHKEITLDKLEQEDDEERFSSLCNFEPARQIRQKLSTAPFIASTEEILGDLKGTWPNKKKEDIWKLLDNMSTAVSEGQNFLPLRAHLFQKTLDGLYVCTNFKCTQKTPELRHSDWKFGQIYFSEKNTCLCGAPVQPLVTCGSCGQEYLLGDEKLLPNGKYSLEQPEKSQDDDEFIWDLDIETQNENDDEQTVPQKSHSEKILLHVEKYKDARKFYLEKNNRELASVPTDICLHGQYWDEAECVNCGDHNKAEASIFRLKRLGAPFFLGDSLPTLLEYSPPHGEGPYNGRRMLSFTDSRQGSARIAARLQQDIDRNKVRSVLFHEASKVTDQTQNEDARKQALAQIKALEDAAKQVPENALIFGPMIQTAIDNLQNLGQPPVLSWATAAASIANSKDLSTYMYDTFRDISYENISKADFPDFCLFREFMRRPLRGYQLETLGMIEICYPAIEKIKKAPPSWEQLYSLDKGEEAVADWKDWLTIFVDMQLRGNTVVDFPETWGKLMGAKVFRKYVVGPGDQREDRTLKWPSAVRSINSRVIKLLIRGFNLDYTDRAVIDQLDTILLDAWNELIKAVLSIKDENRYLVSLKEKSAFRRINKAFKCPYSHRLVSRLFRGQSPNTPANATSIKDCPPISLPALPFSHETDSGGRQKIREWLETDPTIEEARRSNVWPNRADRIAMGEPWFRISEHSAQVDSIDLKRYEHLFKTGKLNVLSCSTTMEMGVDIGGMSVVAMNNVPPHPANYLQRAGRAGRRNEAMSVAYTLCKASAHSMQIFDNPLWLFSADQVAVPSVSLQSIGIVQRHVNAYLFSLWLKKTSSGSLSMTTGGFLLTKQEKEHAPVDEFIAWCRSIREEPNSKTMEQGIQNITKQTPLFVRPISQHGNICAEMISSFYDKWFQEYSIIKKELKSFQESMKNAGKEPAVKGLEISIRRMEGEYILAEMAGASFLPGYGFPTNVVSFDNLTIEDLKHSERHNREDNRSKFRNGPSRELAIALREYAPGAELVLKGKVYRSGGLSLNWHLPADINHKPEIQDLFFYWDCRNCGDFGSTKYHPKQCPSCSADPTKLVIKNAIKPAGFATDFYESPHTDVNRPVFMPYEEPKVAAVSESWTSFSNPLLGGSRYSDEGVVNFLNSGLYEHGYTLCLSCGRAEPQVSANQPSQKVLYQHLKLRGGKGEAEGRYCVGPDNPYMIRENLYLSAQIQTSVFEWQLIDPRDNFQPCRDPSVAWTVGYSLRNALTHFLGIDISEVDVSIRDMRFSDGKSGWVICLFDTASQGAGYVERLQQDFEKLLKRALQSLKCSANCESSCTHCLLDNNSQHHEKNLNRHEGINFLTPWLKALSLPDDLNFFGPKTIAVMSSLECQIELALRELPQRNEQASTLQFFIEYDEKLPSIISEWKMFDVSLKAIQNDLFVDWILSDGSEKEWNSKCGNQFLALIEIGKGRLNIRQLSTNNSMGDGGKIAAGVTCSQYFRYWAGKAIDLSFSSSWGQSEFPLVTSSEWLEKIKFPTTELDLEISRLKPVANSVSVKFASEIDGPVPTFGDRIIEFSKARFTTLAEQLESPKTFLTQISYSDRYIKTPVHLMMLNSLLRSLRQATNSPDLRIKVQTIQFPNTGRRPIKKSEDFLNSSIRDDLLKGILNNMTSKSDVISKGYVQHPRILTLKFSDSNVFEINLDQGFGCWHYSGDNEWDTSLPIDEQIKCIVEDRGNIAMNTVYGSIISFRKN